jgi:hypothetical protein
MKHLPRIRRRSGTEGVVQVREHHVYVPVLKVREEDVFVGEGAVEAGWDSGGKRTNGEDAEDLLRDDWMERRGGL